MRIQCEGIHRILVTENQLGLHLHPAQRTVCPLGICFPSTYKHVEEFVCGKTSSQAEIFSSPYLTSISKSSKQTILKTEGLCCALLKICKQTELFVHLIFFLRVRISLKIRGEQVGLCRLRLPGSGIRRAGLPVVTCRSLNLCSCLISQYFSCLLSSASNRMQSTGYSCRCKGRTMK